MKKIKCMLLLHSSRAEVCMYCIVLDKNLPYLPLSSLPFPPLKSPPLTHPSSHPSSQPSPPPLTPLSSTLPSTSYTSLLSTLPSFPPSLTVSPPPSHAQITTQWCLLSPGPPWIHTKQCHDGQSEHLHARARREVSQERDQSRPL